MKHQLLNNIQSENYEVNHKQPLGYTYGKLSALPQNKLSDHANSTSNLAYPDTDKKLNSNLDQDKYSSILANSIPDKSNNNENNYLDTDIIPRSNLSDQDTDNILSKLYSELDIDKIEYRRSERFTLQSVVRKLLPNSGTATCLRCRRTNMNEVHIKHSFVNNSAHFDGLQTCKSRWICPVCTEKLNYQNKNEIRLAVDKNIIDGGNILLLTLTIPHSRSDKLIDLLNKQSQAMSSFGSHKSAKRLRNEIGCLGIIKTYEVTYGRNGWHPHYHCYVFVNAGLYLEYVRNKFSNLWNTCCELAGFNKLSDRYGVMLSDGSKAAIYTAKGGLGIDSLHEINSDTKSELDKKYSRTPFELLRSYHYHKDYEAGNLFIEYANAFLGKHPVTWSHGLKKRFGINEISDSEIINKSDDFDILLTLSKEDLEAVMHFNVRTEILNLAKSGSPYYLRDVIDELVMKKRMGYKNLDKSDLQDIFLIKN